MHGDESDQAMQFQTLWLEGNYKYNPKDFHGPSLYFLTLPFVKLSGAETKADLNKWHFRGFTLLFSLLTFCLFPLIHSVNKKSLLFAAFFLAISPTMTFYSRYFIQEPLLIFFSLSFLVCLWQYFYSYKLKWAICGGLSLGMMHCTKETYVITIFSAFFSMVIVVVWQAKTEEKKKWPKIPRQHILWFLVMAMIMTTIFYSSFFKHWSGPLESVTAFTHHLKRGSGGEFEEHITQGVGHVKPWYYFLKTTYFHYQDSAKEFWAALFKNKPFRPLGEPLILLLALVAMITSIRKQNNSQILFTRALSIYSLNMLVVYSMIPYKTPWCLQNFHIGFIILAGIGANALIERLHKKNIAKILFFIVMGIFCVDQLQQIKLLGTRIASDSEYNPLAYSHTPSDLEEVLTSRMPFLAKTHADAYDIPIHISAPAYSPLPWYLKEFKNVGYHEGRFPPSLKLKTLPLIIVSADNSTVNKELEETHHGDLWALRPNHFLLAHIRKDLWDKFIKVRSQKK